MVDLKVIATVIAKDEATAKIKAISELARHEQNEMARYSVGASMRMGEGFGAGIATMGRPVDEMRQRLGALQAEAVAGFGAIAGHALGAMLKTGGAMEAIQRRISSYVDINREGLRKLREQADTLGASLPGGPEAFFSAARAAGMSGVPSQFLGVAAKYGTLFADETGGDPASSTEKLFGHAVMTGELHNEQGKIVPTSELTGSEIERGLRQALNNIIAINRVAPGNAENIYDAVRYLGPIAVSLKRPREEIFAEITEAANHGLIGEEGGNTLKSALARLAAPTQGARTAIQTLGLRMQDYVQVDEKSINSAGIEQGLSARLGTLNAKITAGVEGAVKRFGSDHDFDNLQRSIVDTLRSSGMKGVKSMTEAGNLARDVLTNFLQTVDMPRFIRDAQAKGAGVGFFDEVFGKQIGGKIAGLSGANILKYEEQYKTALTEDNVSRAQQERAQSYAGQKDIFENTIKGFEDQLFSAGLEKPLSGLYGIGTQAMQTLMAGPNAIKAWVAQFAVASSVIGGSAAASTLGRIAGALTGLVPSADSAAGRLLALSEAIGSFAALRFAGGGLAGIQFLDAVKPALAELGSIIRGKYYTPDSDIAASGLRDELADRQQELAKHQKTAFQYENNDPTLKALTERQKLMETDPSMRDRIAAERQKLIDHRAAAAQGNAPEIASLQAALAQLTAQPTRSRFWLREIEAIRSQIDAARQKLVEADTAEIEKRSIDLDLPGAIQARRDELVKERPFDPVADALSRDIQNLRNRLASFEAARDPLSSPLAQITPSGDLRLPTKPWEIERDYRGNPFLDPSASGLGIFIPESVPPIVSDAVSANRFQVYPPLSTVPLPEALPRPDAPAHGSLRSPIDLSSVPPIVSDAVPADRFRVYPPLSTVRPIELSPALHDFIIGGAVQPAPMERPHFPEFTLPDYSKIPPMPWSKPDQIPIKIDPVEVKNNPVSGSVDVINKIIIQPSAMFDAKIDGLERKITVSLHEDQRGTGSSFSGSNAPQSGIGHR